MNRNTPIVVVVAVAIVILSSLGIAGYAMVNTSDFQYKLDLKFNRDAIEVQTEIKKESGNTYLPR